MFDKEIEASNFHPTTIKSTSRAYLATIANKFRSPSPPSIFIAGYSPSRFVSTPSTVSTADLSVDTVMDKLAQFSPSPSVVIVPKSVPALSMSAALPAANDNNSSSFNILNSIF